MLIKGILFDFDGTLTKPGALDFPHIKKVLGCRPDQSILEYIDSLSLKDRERAYRLLAEFEATGARNSKPREGAEKVLRLLQKRGFCLGIITRNSRESVLISLRNFNGIDATDFKVILGREAGAPKPHPDGVYIAAHLMRIEPSELLMVGDFRFDIQAGHAAGARTVLITDDGLSSLSPGEPRPDHTIKKLSELIKIVENYNPQKDACLKVS
nr:HAD family hydrolase [Desulfobacterales bacterium]